MKILYVIRKGLQIYPPCLMNILYLYDLGVDVFVIHGDNSEYINEIFNQKGIKHIQLKSDKGLSTNIVQSLFRYFSYIYEINKIVSNINDDEVLWFGNETSFLGIRTNKLIKHKIVLSILELNDHHLILDLLLRKRLSIVNIISCPEKHRAQIIKSRYSLKTVPYVLPNKPYEIKINESKYTDIVNKEAISLIYQGVLDKDRPIIKFAEALRKINNNRIYFYVLGKCDENYKLEIKKAYNNTIFINYIASPLHLMVTKQCKIGVLLYDNSCLNNIFCAPNKVYEYSRFGLPMIASNNIGLVETIGNAKAGICVDYNDVESIYNGLKKIINNYDYYSKKSLEFYKKQNNKKIISNIIKELEKND